jgi:hypothetical protein
MANVYYIVEKAQATVASKVVTMYGVAVTFAPVTVDSISRLGAVVPDTTTDEQAIEDFAEHATMETVHPSRVAESGYSPPPPAPEEDPDPPDIYWLTTFADEQELRNAIHTDPVGSDPRTFADYRLRCCTYMGRQTIEVTKPIKLGNTQLKAWGQYGPLNQGDFALTIRAVASEHWQPGDAVIELDSYSSIEGICIDANGVADFAAKFAGSETSRGCGFLGDVYFEACQVSSFYSMYVREGTCYAYACNGASFHHLSIHNSPGKGLVIRSAGATGTFGPDGTECPQGAGGCSFHGARIEGCANDGVDVSMGSVVAFFGGHMEGCAEDVDSYNFRHAGKCTLFVQGMLITNTDAPVARIEGTAEQTVFWGCHVGGNINNHYVEKAAEVPAGWFYDFTATRYNGTLPLTVVDE